ncbi:hypothetical protein SDC9_168375 [bioreactor metagenome]|uniref:Uncharacterized protein n=1 Tax=bioreactor metagenome TaxID=1076179 RepID=A0A645G4D2_9ZZZZ
MQTDAPSFQVAAEGKGTGSHPAAQQGAFTQNGKNLIGRNRIPQHQAGVVNGDGAAAVGRDAAVLSIAAALLWAGFLVMDGLEHGLAPAPQSGK